MIKIIIPIEEETLDDTAALLKMSENPKIRAAIDAALAKIKQEGTVEASQKILQKEDLEEVFEGIACLAILSKIPENLQKEQV